MDKPKGNYQCKEMRTDARTGMAGVSGEGIDRIENEAAEISWSTTLV